MFFNDVIAMNPIGHDTYSSLPVWRLFTGCEKRLSPRFMCFNFVLNEKQTRQLDVMGN